MEERSVLEVIQATGHVKGHNVQEMAAGLNGAVGLTVRSHVGLVVNRYVFEVAVILHPYMVARPVLHQILRTRGFAILWIAI